MEGQGYYDLGPWSLPPGGKILPDPASTSCLARHSDWRRAPLLRLQPGPRGYRNSTTIRGACWRRPL